MKRLVYLLVRLRQRRIDNAKINIEPPTAWQSIFEQSRVNGGESIVKSEQTGWKWPTSTWFEERRRLLQSQERGRR